MSGPIAKIHVGGRVEIFRTIAEAVAVTPGATCNGVKIAANWGGFEGREAIDRKGKVEAPGIKWRWSTLRETAAFRADQKDRVSKLAQGIWPE